MKYLSLFLLSLLLFSCGEPKEESISIIGSWRIIEKNGKEVKVQDGYQFAEDYQYFAMNTQGRPITRFHPKYWNMSNDTLTLVDMNFEERFRDTKGTTKYLIIRLEKDRLELKLLSNDEKDISVYQRI
jgi:hypothetical protein